MRPLRAFDDELRTLEPYPERVLRHAGEVRDEKDFVLVFVDVDPWCDGHDLRLTRVEPGLGSLVELASLCR